MSYFMVISGPVAPADLPAGMKLLPIAHAQPYVASLERTLTQYDGAPLFLVDDGESDTSHCLVAEVGQALIESRPLREVPFVALIEACFREGWSFRVWDADNDPEAHLKNTVSVADFETALENLERGNACVCWHAS